MPRPKKQIETIETQEVDVNPGNGTGQEPSPTQEKPKPSKPLSKDQMLSQMAATDAEIIGSLRIDHVGGEHLKLLLDVESVFKDEYLEEYHSYLMGDPDIKDEVQPKDQFGRLRDKNTGQPIPKRTREYHPAVWPNNLHRSFPSVQEAVKNKWRLCIRAENPEIRDECFDTEGKVPLAYGEYVLMWRPIEVGRKIYEATHAESIRRYERIFLGEHRDDGEFTKRVGAMKVKDALGSGVSIDEEIHSAVKIQED